jgi:hyperosmotically inducible protein
MRGRLASALALAGILALGGCATTDPWGDARIESEVKARLVAEKDVNLTRLGVVSRKSVVYLSGRVESPAERERAQQLAAGVAGVQRVVNAVDVRGPDGTPR